MDSEKYTNLEVLSLNTKTLKAISWVAGRNIEEVFTVPGKYIIDVGIRMETDYQKYSSCTVELTK